MFQSFSWHTGVYILTVVFSVPTSWNQFFMLDVYHTDGTPLTTDQLCVQLERICDSSQQAAEEPVGILTSQHRDSWGKVYTKLISGELTRCFSANYAAFPRMVSALLAFLCIRCLPLWYSKNITQYVQVFSPIIGLLWTRPASVRVLSVLHLNTPVGSSADPDRMYSFQFVCL